MTMYDRPATPPPMHDQLHAIMRELFLLRHRGANALQVPAATSIPVLVSGRGKLLGWSLKDNNNVGGSAIDLLDGISSSGSFLGRIALAQNATETRWLGDTGVTFEGGVFANVVTATMSGVVYVIPQVRLDIMENDDEFRWPTVIGAGPS